jgi:hypothetical protein
MPGLWLMDKRKRQLGGSMKQETIFKIRADGFTDGVRFALEHLYQTFPGITGTNLWDTYMVPSDESEDMA